MSDILTEMTDAELERIWLEFELGLPLPPLVTAQTGPTGPELVFTRGKERHFWTKRFPQKTNRVWQKILVLG